MKFTLKNSEVVEIKQLDRTISARQILTVFTPIVKESPEPFNLSNTVPSLAEEKKWIGFQPFPLFRESTLRLYLSLIYDTIKIDISAENGKIKTKQRPLSLAEIDPILMQTWLRYGNYNTFYVPVPTKGYKRMRDYNWSNSADGIKFEDHKSS